jgi:HK97 family phage prohead protease
MRATLKKDDRGHEELYSDIQSGLIDKMSFAFTVKESKLEEIERSDEPNLEIRTITKIDRLYDVSAVDIPAYDTTSISARKAFDAESKEREAESLRKAKEVEMAKAKYFYGGIL